jgi:excisionase family DNA binding protein
VLEVGPIITGIVDMNMSKVRPKVYTVAEFARVFVISPRLVRDLIRKGELPALRIGRSYRIPRKVAAAYLDRALPSMTRPTTKPRVRIRDDQTGFLFPIGTMQ